MKKTVLEAPAHGALRTVRVIWLTVHKQASAEVLRRQRLNRVGGNRAMQAASATPLLAVADAPSKLLTLKSFVYANFEC